MSRSLSLAASAASALLGLTQASPSQTQNQNTVPMATTIQASFGQNSLFTGLGIAAGAVLLTAVAVRRVDRQAPQGNGGLHLDDPASRKGTRFAAIPAGSYHSRSR
ncbi:MAG: hypothetical protein AB7G80_03450 [Dongiaceae bacterium]